MIRWTFIVILTGLITAESCNQIEDCQLDPYGDAVIVRFNKVSTEIDSIHFSSISLDGWGILGENITAQVLALPLNAEESRAQYSFSTDSVTFFFDLKYDTEASIYELRCEPSIRYFDLEIGEQNFDSLILVADEINLQYLPINVEIYF